MSPNYKQTFSIGLYSTDCEYCAFLQVFFCQVQRHCDFVFYNIDIDVIKNRSVFGDFFAIRAGDITGWNQQSIINQCFFYLRIGCVHEWNDWDHLDIKTTLLFYGMEKMWSVDVYADIVCTKQTRSNISMDLLRKYAFAE
jgi:hypothetical protein